MSTTTNNHLAKLSETEKQLLDNDQKLAQRVERILADQHFPTIRRLSVDVYDGVVTVTGQVTTWHEKQVAISTCQQVPGVDSLVDQIDVGDYLILGQL